MLVMGFAWVTSGLKRRGKEITEIVIVLLSLCGSPFSRGKKKEKDTASKLRSESRRPRFSAQGQMPSRMVDMGSHDARSAGKEQNLY